MPSAPQPLASDVEGAHQPAPRGTCLTHLPNASLLIPHNTPPSQMRRAQYSPPAGLPRLNRWRHPFRRAPGEFNRSLHPIFFETTQPPRSIRYAWFHTFFEAQPKDHTPKHNFYSKRRSFYGFSVFVFTSMHHCQCTTYLPSAMFPALGK